MRRKYKARWRALPLPASALHLAIPMEIVMSPKVRKATKLPLDDALITEAMALGLDVSNAAEAGIARAVKAEKERRWKIENADALRAANDYVAEHGLPLAKYRIW